MRNALHSRVKSNFKFKRKIHHPISTSQITAWLTTATQVVTDTIVANTSGLPLVTSTSQFINIGGPAILAAPTASIASFRGSIEDEKNEGRRAARAKRKAPEPYNEDQENPTEASALVSKKEVEPISKRRLVAETILQLGLPAGIAYGAKVGMDAVLSAAGVVNPITIVALRGLSTYACSSIGTGVLHYLIAQGRNPYQEGFDEEKSKDKIWQPSISHS